MADNVAITAGSGTTIATQERGTSHVQMVVETQELTRIQVTPTISTGIYAAKDAIGGLYTFSNAARYSGGSGRLLAVTVVDKDQEKADMDLVLFRATFTAPTDNAVFDPTDAELLDCIGWVPIGSGMYADFNDNSVAHVDCNVAFTLAGTDLFAAMVSRGTPTYTATSDLVVTLTIAQD